MSAVLDSQTGGTTGHVLSQVVRYTYSSPVTDLRQRLVVVPPEVHGAQRRVRHHFDVIGVDGATWVTRTDRWGNTVIDVQVPIVDHEVEFVIGAGTVCEGPAHTIGAAGRFLPPTHLTTAPVLGPLADLVRAAAGADPAGICTLVHRSLTYRAGSTGIRTTAAEAAAGGVGVCQDFAHVMLAVCRAVGLPARYVSGHLAGEGASHAWVETLAPAQVGRRTRFIVEAWDPTHARRTDGRYLTVATGRDYGDVAPMSGTFEADELVDADLTVTKTLTVDTGAAVRTTGVPDREGATAAAGGTAAVILTRARLRVDGVVADLEAELAAIEQAGAAGPDDEHDAEGSTIGYERARVGSLLMRARRERQALDGAGRRVAAGTYGCCERCGGPIGPERLDALPATRSCMTCATGRRDPAPPDRHT